MTEGNGKLDILIDQVGRLTEGLTEFRADIVDMRELVREQLALTQAQGERIDRLVEQGEAQGKRIDRLTEVVERQAEAVEQQVEVAKHQAATAERQMQVSERLAATVERQAQMLETLIERQSH
jgi:methyl-accepting chemotaxis protein